MNKQIKLWGNTQCIFQGMYSEVYYLNINKGGYCSDHTHNNKWNRFFILDGRISINLKDDNYTISIGTGQYFDIKPGVLHSFMAEEDTECLEIYWVDTIDPDDIFRKNIGGIKNE